MDPLKRLFIEYRSIRLKLIAFFIEAISVGSGRGEKPEKGCSCTLDLDMLLAFSILSTKTLSLAGIRTQPLPVVLVNLGRARAIFLLSC